MDPMSEYLAHVTIEAKLAAGNERRAGRLLREERRAERRRRRQARPGDLVGENWVANGPRSGRGGSLTAAPTSAFPPSVEVARPARARPPTGSRSCGTGSERRLLEAMAEVAAASAPGAAAALVDRRAARPPD